uniref:Uncharacterized protein n=1 Tax=Meloidogyne incognita TaxID=6306 RepID=A0A914MU07_MELIC
MILLRLDQLHNQFQQPTLAELGTLLLRNKILMEIFVVNLLHPQGQNNSLAISLEENSISNGRSSNISERSLSICSELNSRIMFQRGGRNRANEESNKLECQYFHNILLLFFHVKSHLSRACRNLCNFCQNLMAIMQTLTN